MTLLGIVIHEEFTAVRTAHVLLKVDPYVVERVLGGQKPVAYVVIEPSNMQFLPPPLKSWRFGSKLILKYRLDDRLLKLVSKYAIYVSCPRAVSIIEDPLGILRRMVSRELAKSLEEAKKYKGDIKRVFHKASDRFLGKGVVVAVIDSGIDYLHPDLYENVHAVVSMLVYGNNHPLVWIKGVNGTWEEAWVYEKEVYESINRYPWMDLLGHGTHVSGIIAGNGYASNGTVLGLAPNATIIMVKAFFDNGSSTTDIILNALKWVKEHRYTFNITVVNLSFGARVPSNGLDPISLACDELVKMGLIVLAAAGNNYAFPFTISAPAAGRKVFCIGAINPYNKKIPLWTAIGPTVDGRIKPDFIAAGVWVLAPKPVTVKCYFEKVYPVLVYDGYYMYLSGTSMSTAVASGIVAEWVEWYRYVFRATPSFRTVYVLLSQSTIRINFLGKDVVSGEGIIVGPR
ncbi:hypothetical protein DRJ19_03465 [Candidatus Woesearchaeota archaeon]|nr:MAG: hypothetical protein DRJ19_03465 [Candidatus Woesearchaeota archaeon]